jgi:Bax protein
MRKKWLLLFLVSFVASQTVIGQSAYIKKYRKLADSISNVYGIPVKLILGVAVIESSSGTSRNARLLNNHFGIVGKNRLLKTHGIKTMYKQYNNPAESFIDFAKVISRKKYYTQMKNDTSCYKWINVMSQHGYSVKPESWRKVMMSTINKIKI